MSSDKHSAEFENSAIDAGLVKLNIKSVDLSWTFDNDLENEDIGFILESLNWNTSRKNDGRLRDATIKSICKLDGGWCITPFWGLGDGQQTDYFRFKPDVPPADPKKPGKFKRYLGAVSSSVRLYTPNVSESIWAIIACRYDVEKSGNNFWEWILDHPEIPVIITEGEKKALSGLSAGYVTASLPGIDCGYKSVLAEDGETKHLELIPDLIALTGGERHILIAFDRDINPKTIQRVARSRQKLAKLFADLGCQTFCIQWSDEFKGLDDFLANSKPKAIDLAITQPVNISPVVKAPGAASTALTFFDSSVERGLELVRLNGDGEEERELIGNHLKAIAYVNNPTQDGAALLLEFQTVRSGIRRWTIPRCELAGEGKEILGGLLSRDYSSKRRQKSLLLDYLYGLGSKVEESFTITDSSGWVGKSFVLPHKTYGDDRLRFRDVDPSPEAITEIKGTLQGWKDGVAAKCAGNSRLIFVLGASFAGPLLSIVDIESGGFHLLGDTSQGKTTLLSVAASVTGIKDIPHWRTTTNGLESTATAFNHLCLPLDEIGQADPKDVGNIAYMLANGQGKTRMTKNLTNRKGKTWRLLVLSSGEFRIAKYMALANITQKGGQEVRLPDVPAAPRNSLYGCFETIHEFKEPEDFVYSLEAEVKKHHGTAMDAFLTRVVVDIADPQFAGIFAKQVYTAAAKLAAGTSDSAIGRVAKRFGLLQVVLERAHGYNLLPIPYSDIDWSIKECFIDWLRARGGDGSIEVLQAVNRIEHLLVTNEFSDRVFTLPNNNDRPVRNLLAYRKVDFEGNTSEILVPTSVFDKEFCEGANKNELVKHLEKKGWLLPPRKDGKFTHQREIKGKSNYYFIFRNTVFSSEGSEGSEGKPSKADEVTVSDPSPSLHQPISAGEGSEGKTKGSESSLHCLHHENNDSEGKVKAAKADPETVLDEPSLPSLPSPPKTTSQDEKINKKDFVLNQKVPKIGDFVLYIGSNKSLKRQYKGLLKVHSLSLDGVCCYKEDKTLTSWIPLEDIQ
jgi:putative DNA primase/helicase